MIKRYGFFLSFLITLGTTNRCYAQGLPVDSAGIHRLPSIPFLPDPLVLDEGGKNIPVVTASQWKQKQQWIKEQYQYWVSGSVPPPPASFKVNVLSERREGGVTLRMVELTFGPDEKGKMTVELMIPETKKRLPVFMTQWNHRGWAQVAVRRGYIGCVYAGADSKDDTRNYGELYPAFDFATLMKRAWGASRVIDYLHKLPEVDTGGIALTGHSRNGKQALMAAAFDQRIKAVVSSSGGTGGESTFRWSDYRFTPGSFDRMVRFNPHWFSPRMNWFIGTEHKLPVDQNSLMSLIAPRGLMLVSAITEHEGNPWGVEQSYKSVKKVYRFLKADGKVSILLRQGRHQHSAIDAERFLDFFDYIFGRSSLAPENKLYYNYSFQEWKRLSGVNINPLKYPVNEKTSTSKFSRKKSFLEQQETIRKKIRWLLGDEPPGVAPTSNLSPILSKNRTYPGDYLAEVIGESALPDNIKKMTIGPYTGLGDNLWGTVYFPPGAVARDSVPGKLPLIIYLHEYAYATGYHRTGISAIRHFTENGFAVLAFDMVGFGTRIEEATHFYKRYPHWSLMGKMVADAIAIISDACTKMPFIDSANIYLVGYSLGGTVALITGALDKRVKGVAVAGAFSSLRKDNLGSEGILHYSHLHGLLPNLGFFIGYEDRVPVDFDEILACLAPRSLLVIAPRQDRAHTASIVQEMVSGVSTLYSGLNTQNNFAFEQPATYSNFPDSLQKLVATWLSQRRMSSP